MAKRRRPQPRDSRGRFTTTGWPTWATILIVAVIVLWMLGK